MKAVVKKQQTVDALVESFKDASITRASLSKRTMPSARLSLLRVSSTTL